MKAVFSRIATPWRVLGLACLLAGAYATIANGGYRHNVHVVKKVRDRAGNVEEIQSVSFEIDSGSGGGPACLPQSDEFDGEGLDAKWDVLRPTGDVEATSGWWRAIRNRCTPTTRCRS